MYWVNATGYHAGGQGVHTATENMQPGFLSGKKYTKLGGSQANQIIQAFYNDMAKLKIKVTQPFPTIYNKNKSYQVAGVLRSGQYRSGKYIGPRVTDYHWYRTDANSVYWSHKRGTAGKITNLDASSKKNYNPKYADRDYGGPDYKIYVGQYCLYI